MKKEIIVCIIIVIAIIVGNIVTQNYTVKSIGILSEELEQLKDADLNIIKIRLDKNTINNEIPIATYFMSSDGN